MIAEMRSLGIGSLLMKASKEYGIANGAEFIRTQVFPQNVSGMKFYAQNGFIEDYRMSTRPQKFRQRQLKY